MNISIDALRSYVEKIAKLVLKDESSKPVVVGTIKSSLPGYYKVQLVNGNETSLVHAESLYADKVFAKDDYIYLVRAEVARGEEYDTKYFIVGLVTNIEQNYANLTDNERFLGDGQIIKNLAVLEKNDSSVTVADEKLINAIRANGVFSFSAIVNTKIANSQDFGLLFTLTFDEGEPQKIKFPGITFVGQPWNLIGIKQKKIFDIGENNKLKQIEITLYKNGFINGDEFKVAEIQLESGTFINLVNDFTVELENISNRNYFNKENDNGIVQIKANVKYGNQKLDTTALKYYWFVKKENAININSLGGEGWECLNESSPIKYVEEGKIVIDDRTLIYKTSNDTLTIDYDKANTNNWLPHYENEIKCVIGYQLANATSDPIKVYNFNHESYDIVIKEKSGENPILYSDEFITLEAEYTSKIVNPTGELKFKWYKKEVNKDTQLGYFVTEKDENEEEKKVWYSYDDNVIKIFGQNGKENTSNGYVMQSEYEEFYCEAFLGDNLVGTSNNITISSKVSMMSDLVEKTIYRYWIDTKSNTRFVSKVETEEIKEENSTGETTFEDLYVYYTTEDDNEGVELDDLKDLKSDELFKKIEAGEYYLYYTEQKLIIDKNHNDNVFRYNDYIYPRILRYVYVDKKDAVTDLILDSAIDKLNTFNELTDGGRAQGIEYTGAVYDTTKDDAPVSGKLVTGKGYYKKVDTYEYKSVGKLTNFEEGKEYYYRGDDGVTYTLATETTPVEDRVYYIYELVKTDYVLRPQNSDNYILGTDNKPIGFKTDEDYYEQNGGDLYINASFIRSGHLEVADGEKTVFSADLDTKTVKLGGFHVKDDHFASGEAIDTGDHKVLVSPGYGPDKDENGKEISQFAFWAGNREKDSDKDETRPFWVKNDGTVRATNLIVTTEQVTGLNNTITNLKTATSGFIVNGDDVYVNAEKTLYLGAANSGSFIINTPALQFNVNNDKKLIVKGTIEAESGTIGGFHITGTHLADGDTETPTIAEHKVMLSGTGISGSQDNPFGEGDFVFWAGDGETGAEKPFSIKKNGNVVAKNLTVGDGTISGGTISGATISGGKISGATISSDSLGNNVLIENGTIKTAGRDLFNTELSQGALKFGSSTADNSIYIVAAQSEKTMFIQIFGGVLDLSLLTGLILPSANNITYAD